MENLARTSVERILILTCCLIVAPTITTPIEDLGLDSENGVPVSAPHYPDEESSTGDTWNYNFPSLPALIQSKLSDTKRRSSFFPVRGKKGAQDVESETSGGYVFYPQIAKKDVIFLPAIRKTPYKFFDVPQDDQRFSSANSLENVSASLGLTRPSDWQEAQKRRSSFMPMRGRKRFINRNNLQLTKRYLPSEVHDDLTDATFDDADKVKKEVETYEDDKMNYPKFHENLDKDGAKFFDRNQIENHIRFVRDNRRPVNTNGASASNSKSFVSDNNNFAKRALSFVPTRGRRGRLDDTVSEFLPHVSVESSEWYPEDSSSGKADTKLAHFVRIAGGKTQERYRRASAFLPMRGRKSSGTPYWLAYNYLPHEMRTDDVRGPLENMEHVWKTSEPVFEGDTKYKKAKKFFDELENSAQKLRTAVVMKRPSLSFFAARGKRLNGGGVDNVL